MSHEVISSFVAIGMFIVISLVIIGVVGGVGAIVEAFRERNELRVTANARNEIYSRHGREIAELRAENNSLKIKEQLLKREHLEELAVALNHLDVVRQENERLLRDNKELRAMLAGKVIG